MLSFYRFVNISYQLLLFMKNSGSTYPVINRSIALFILSSFLLLAGCSSGPEKPAVSSDQYKQAVSDFYVSLAAIQSDQAPFAIKKMKEVAETYPDEPAAWANLGVYAMRQGNFEQATEQLNKALQKSSNNGDLQFLSGILESRKGNVEAAIQHFSRAVSLDSTNSRILFALANELERQDPQQNADRIRALLNQILQQDPDNLAVLLETVRTAAKWQDNAAFREALNKMEELSENWPEEIKNQFLQHKSAILEKGGKDITFELAFLRNNLNQLSKFQSDLREVQLPPNQVGFLVNRFLWLPNSSNRAAPRDTSLTFRAERQLDSESVTPQLFKPVELAEGRQAHTVSVHNGRATISGLNTLDFPGGSATGQLPVSAITVIDYNYDFLSDLAMAGPGGFKLYEQQSDSTFSEVTGSLNLPSSVLNDSYYGSWDLDFELDGDLDLLLSATDGKTILLRNNGDGTFDVRPAFEFSKNIIDLIWTDFDEDGDADVALLKEDGTIDMYSNERSGKYKLDTTFDFGSNSRAISYGDLNGDGRFELVSLKPEQIRRSWYSDSTASWQDETLISFDDESALSDGQARLFVVDLDNNGALDLLSAGSGGSRYWLSDEDMKLQEQSYPIKAQVSGFTDTNGDMRLDLFGLSSDRQALRLLNEGSKSYKARMIRPRASGPLGDKRINSFGIGGEIESRSGLQYVKQPINKPWVHVGLGDYEEAEMLRIIWPNGSMQAEFAELGYESKIKNEQILKGSCPWVLTYNGEQMEFVTDFLWRTALGLKINAQGKANVIHSIDWIKIDGDQLKPRDGYYDVRITADLWETHFFDHVSLMAVDHPKDTEVLVDERFTLPAPKQQLYPMKKTYPVQSAVDQDGRNVTEEIASKDGNYITSFNRTAFQGIAEEHFVEIDLGPKPDESGSEQLIASGWVYPTDTSINIALSQGNYEPPHGVRVEVPDGHGGWKVARADVGFPAGKHKTMIINLENIFEAGTERKLRLSTNMEIYWDQIRLGLQDEVPVDTTRLTASESILRYRGFSKLVQKGRLSPTEPDYQQLAGTTPKWRDLVGFYTRFGEVGELTQKIDDRYVIMNAGDELVFKFPELDPPREGWTRDFVLIGDGWVKDGDYNTGHSKTVLPLPYHGMEDYTAEPGLLHEDPVYQKHKQDWVQYHTRYITPQNFNTALRFQN